MSAKRQHCNRLSKSTRSPSLVVAISASPLARKPVGHMISQNSAIFSSPHPLPSTILRHLRAVSLSRSPDRTRSSEGTEPRPSLSKCLNTAFSSSTQPCGQSWGVGTRHRLLLSAKSSHQAFICFSSGIPEHGHRKRIMSSMHTVFFLTVKTWPSFSHNLAANLALSSGVPAPSGASCEVSSLFGRLFWTEGRRSCLETSAHRSCLQSLASLSVTCLNS
mmetsp:Transcript_39247/g.117278  ORF Transcript_39247/g.117278 Transcript_39247/m.117278 type:complete len:219 (+) Transcript_39247:52-708(+)